MGAEGVGRPESIVDRLEANADVFAGLLRGVSPTLAVLRSDPDRWSILEVVCHLADEEIEDFRTRIDYALHRPDETWPPIDPEGWVTERGYAGRDLSEEADRFLERRSDSVAWLRGLEAPDWASTGVHPRLGPLSAGTLLANWLAHDLIHVRQITRLHRQALEAELPGAPLDYAGRW